MIDADMNELRGLGVIQEANRRFFHPLGLHIVHDEAAMLKITSSSAGVVFEPVYIDRGRKRRFEEFAEARLTVRQEALGYYIQPAEDLPEAARVAICSDCVHSAQYVTTSGVAYTCKKVREVFTSHAPAQFMPCVQRNPKGTCEDFEVPVDALTVSARFNKLNCVKAANLRPEVAKDC